MGRHHRAALDHKLLQQQLVESPACHVCGERLGRHRYATDQCPNSLWRAGNGESQWLTSVFTSVPRISVEMEQ